MNNIKNKILTSLLTIGLASGCSSVKYTNISKKDISKLSNPNYSFIRLESGIVTGKIDTDDYKKYDSLSNNYSVFILTMINGEHTYFNYQDRGLHRQVAEDSIVHILYREVYSRNKKGSTFEGIEIQRVVPKSKSLKEGLPKQYGIETRLKF